MYKLSVNDLDRDLSVRWLVVWLVERGGEMVLGVHTFHRGLVLFDPFFSLIFHP